MSEHSDRPQRMDCEAAQVRRETLSASPPRVGSGAPPWKAGVYLLTMILTVGASMVLLASSELRGRVVMLLAESIQAYADPGQEIFAMPAPRPTGSETIVVGGGVRFSSGPGQDVIYEPDEMTQPDPEAPRSEEFVAAARSPDMEAAFQYLVDNSSLVGRLTRQEVADYEFKQWKPRVNRAPVFFIDLIVEHDGQELTLVWQVDTDRESIRPANQEARDFDRAN